MDLRGLREQMANMDEGQRRALMEKMDKELDQYMDGLESNSSRYVDGWSEDSWEKEMENHPFFATSASGQGSEELSPLMKGIQDLKYSPDENSPEELALNYKEDGNYAFKFKKYRIAVCAYSEGLKHTVELLDLRSTLLNNRASAHFFLKNYGSSLMDARGAIISNPQNTKALIRAAKAAFALSRYEETLEWCDKVLHNSNSSNEEIKTLRSKASAKKSEHERNERKEALRIKKEKATLEALMKEIKKRRIRLLFSRAEKDSLTLEDLSPHHPFAPQAQRVHLEGNTLIWPLILVYPEFQQSDFIQETSEESTFEELLALVFGQGEGPPLWDSKGHYSDPGDLEAFFKVTDRDLIVRIDGREQGLKDVLSDGRCSVVDGLPEIIVLSRKSEFYKEYIKKCVNK